MINNSFAKFKTHLELNITNAERKLNKVKEDWTRDEWSTFMVEHYQNCSLALAKRITDVIDVPFSQRELRMLANTKPLVSSLADLYEKMETMDVDQKLIIQSLLEGISLARLSEIQYHDINKNVVNSNGMKILVSDQWLKLVDELSRTTVSKRAGNAVMYYPEDEYVWKTPVITGVAGTQYITRSKKIVAAYRSMRDRYGLPTSNSIIELGGQGI